jgi:hypothetical protein
MHMPRPAELTQHIRGAGHSRNPGKQIPASPNGKPESNGNVVVSGAPESAGRVSGRLESTGTVVSGPDESIGGTLVSIGRDVSKPPVSVIMPESRVVIPVSDMGIRPARLRLLQPSEAKARTSTSIGRRRKRGELNIVPAS